MFAQLLINSALDLLIKKIEAKPDGKGSKFISFLVSEETQAKVAKAFALYAEVAEKLDGDSE